MTKESAPPQNASPVHQPTIEDILTQVVGVDRHAATSLETVHDLPGSTVGEIAAAIDRDRSTVQRSLADLREWGLLERERRLLDGGGYVYQYYPCPLEDTKERLHALTEAWATAAHDQIDEFERDSLTDSR